ncbi:MAG: hypothetical protein P0Y49_07425 [Candidatus Pedobacter colombiensis]|uniref:Uncharacterized protein n=1 Tax=Candidatus Pedobacter colombiensis TaxID=3121371 RepID=A0AAJ5WE45_9SPHI|nr:hypothetical protein [Pedobacter sp.]WEK20967.1 MAG: hypothetical protein P0Y49_07425 [Pedobacter sp.]
MKKLYFTTSIICLLTFFMGCTKDATTTDTELSYSFNAINLNASLSTNATASGAVVAAGTNGSINWTSASLNISKVEFSATQAGKAISLESKNLFAVNALKPDSLSGTVSLTSGIYEHNEFKISMNESATNPPLVLTGTYIEASGTKIPVIVQLNAAQVINLEAPKIEITKGKYVAKVTVELNGLVKGLTASDFGQTTRTAPNNTILVTNTINRALFEKLALKLPSILSLSLTKQ